MEYLRKQKYWKVVEKALESKGCMPPSFEPKAAPAGPAPKAKAAAAGKGPASSDIRTWKWAFAKTQLPVAKGCLIQPYPARSAYQVYYAQSDEYPRSKTWAHKPPWSEEQVLLACVKWAWLKHESRTGERYASEWPAVEHPMW
jgi:hypothetical protein